MAPDLKAVELAFASMIMLISQVVESCQLDKSLDVDVMRLHDTRRKYTEPA